MITTWSKNKLLSCSLDIFVLDTCTFLGALFNCWWSAVADLQALCCSVHHGCIPPGEIPFAKVSNWWPVPIWSSGSQAELSVTGKWGRQVQGGVLVQNRQPWAFSPVASLWFSSQISVGEQRIVHNYFVKVDVKCWQIAKGFLPASLFLCGLLCRVKPWDKAFPVLALHGLIFQGELTSFSWDLKISQKIWLPENTSLVRSPGRNGKKAENISWEVQMWCCHEHLSPHTHTSPLGKKSWRAHVEVVEKGGLKEAGEKAK